MKTAFLAALALSVCLGGCALTSEQALAPGPSQMSLADIQQEIVTVTRKMIRIRSRPLLSVGTPAPTPVIYYYPDPNGGSFQNYTRADVERRSSTSGRSVAVYDEAQFRALAQRRLELITELRQRTPRTSP